MPKSKYQADGGDIHPIRLSQASLDAAGAPPGGAVDNQIIAKVSKGNREFGLRPRGVNLTREVGSAPNIIIRRKFLPVLTETAYDSATFAVGAVVAVGGTDWEVATKEPEDF